MINERYVNKFLYILIPSLFYENFELKYVPNDEFFVIVKNTIKKYNIDGEIIRSGIFYYFNPKNYILPEQGWKIHVSATIHNAEGILSKVAEILIPKKIPFKFYLDKMVLGMMNFKNADRGSSGKFITIYPSDEEKFKELLEILYENLKNEEGPYILSDKRYKDCKVLYYRYGGIKSNYVIDIIGKKIYVIKSPEGNLIEDKRNPFFTLPPWVKDPFENNEFESGEEDSDVLFLKNKRYIIKKALSFSNSGGVYLAKDTKLNKIVVIKEARPYTTVDDRGNTAIKLLQKEYEILKILEDENVAPKPIDFFQEWEHFFLVEEYIKGENIREIMLSNSPLLDSYISFNASKKFYEIFKKIFVNFVKTVEKIHRKGIVLGDLSPYNVLVNPQKNYEIKIIDFEGAFRKGIDIPTYLFTPGFRKRLSYKKIEDFEDDLYTVGVIMFYSLFPINVLYGLKNDLYDNVLKNMLYDLRWPVKRIYNLIQGVMNAELNYKSIIKILNKPMKIRRTKTCEKEISKKKIVNMIQKFGEFILHNISYEREDRLFPSDPILYLTNPLSLGFGAGGILYSLKKCNFELPKNAFLWLEKKLKEIDIFNYPPGFLTGISGIAWCLWDLNYNEESLRLMKLLEKHELIDKHHSLFYGMAGIGLTYLYFYLHTKENYYLEKSIKIGEMLLQTSKRNKRGIYWKDKERNKVYIGYGYGQSGVALFLLRLYQFTGIKKFLYYGKKALEFDLSYGKELEKGVLTFPDFVGRKGITYEPYIEAGTAGIIKVLLRYGLKDNIDILIKDIRRKYAVFPGLIFGLAGFIDTLTDIYIFTKKDKYLKMVDKPISGILDLFLLKLDSGYALPGEELFRVSCDYATGMAGVMRSLYRYINKENSDFTLDTT